MKAAVWTAPNRLDVREMPIPKPKAGEVRIKVLGCGVCGTDVHIFKGEVPLAMPPQVLGHEIYGEVVEMGRGVKSVRAGDNISIDPVVGCGVCVFCKERRTNLCHNPTIIGYARCGGFAQYTIAPESHCHKASGKIGRKGGIIAETLACVLNGYDRLNFKACRSVMILGAGSVGLLWTDLIKHSVATKLIQTEIIPMRGRLAKKLGADHVIDAEKAGWQKAVMEIEPLGVDYVIDATGTAKAIQESLPLLKRGGTLMIFGVCPEEEQISVTPYDMFARELSIIAAKMPPCTLERAVRIIEAGKIDCERIVSSVMPLDRLEEAIDCHQHAKHKHVKIMIDPWA
ncbi:MAG: alcohol dehydrogenase catalytic domain-containing protein [bacterium]|nr:alcohol dehydrogenase catalytic domain-containing protein [Candidatus Sumerlaeota bacterium]